MRWSLKNTIDIYNCYWPLEGGLPRWLFSSRPSDMTRCTEGQKRFLKKNCCLINIIKSYIFKRNYFKLIPRNKQNNWLIICKIYFFRLVALNKSDQSQLRLRLKPSRDHAETEIFDTFLRLSRLVLVSTIFYKTIYSQKSLDLGIEC